MDKKGSLEYLFEEFPEKRERYEKMSKAEKFLFNTTFYIFKFRKAYKENVLPRWYKELYY